MRRALRSRSLKRVVKRTPGNMLTVHFKKEKPDYAKCGNCGKKIVRARLRPSEIRKLPKDQRRPERPFPELCPKCMREKIKEMIR
jgi:large subunit ribosomal protein L34e